MILDTQITDELVQESFARHFKSSIQKSRKNNGIHIDDFIEVFIE